jgi:hypothetical protein
VEPMDRLTKRIRWTTEESGVPGWLGSAHSASAARSARYSSTSISP